MQVLFLETSASNVTVSHQSRCLRWLSFGTLENCSAHQQTRQTYLHFITFLLHFLNPYQLPSWITEFNLHHLWWFTVGKPTLKSFCQEPINEFNIFECLCLRWHHEAKLSLHFICETRMTMLRNHRRFQIRLLSPHCNPTTFQLSCLKTFPSK